VYAGLNLPMSFMVIKGYMDTIPKELTESARITFPNKTASLGWEASAWWLALGTKRCGKEPLTTI